MPLVDARLWPYRPDAGVIERLEWLTDPIESFSGCEQRIALREWPRRVLEFGVTVSDRERRTAENLLAVGQATRWAVPVWMDNQALQSSLAAGVSSVPVSTATRDFHDGGLVLLATDTAYEIVDVASFTGSAIALSAPTTLSWPAGRTEIVPLRLALMPEEVRLQRFTGDTSTASLSFELIEPAIWTAEDLGTSYRSFPVLGTAPNWTVDIDHTALRKLLRFDAGTGPVFTDEAGSGAISTQSHRWLLDGRAQIETFRRWLYARKGRAAAFWLPTFALDFEVVANIGSSDTTIDVEACGYTALSARGIGRRDIRIELYSGTVYHRRITGSADISASVERLSISSSLGAAVSVSQIRSISFLDLKRLESDAIDLAWSRSDVVEVALGTRGFRDDL